MQSNANKHNALCTYATTLSFDVVQQKWENELHQKCF